MDEKNQIIVKENGKVINKYPDQSIQSSNLESAATLQESDEPVQPFDRKTDLSNVTLQNKTSKFKMFKPVIIAIASAILIGSILSVIMFQILIDVESDITGQSLTALPASSDEAESDENVNHNGNEMSKYSLEPISGFVLQAGVFSEMENAEAWAANFSSLGLPTIVWQRNNQYYLLLGITATKEKATNLAEELNTGEFDVYVKEWSTKSQELQLTEAEYSWLQQFQQSWQTVLESLISSNSLSKDNWNSLTNNQVSESNTLSKLLGLTLNTETLSGLEAHQQMLEIMYAYENIKEGTDN
ncbi:SPOR domain-containing protein [Oceanobacillus senegalensis]|uniref:SPOR domain-containing protein n=1 Tax=Oceanobacillus senegalensis TaxID=1936063 RepID=UPI000A304E2A|nr:SPOR domain-containing protein [Oceanobacillus senegalensis]